MRDADIVLAMLKSGPQSSWDWEADARFARQAKDIPAESLAAAERLAAGHFGVAPIAMGFHDLHVRPITARRLRALRKLVKAGLVAASWEGTGTGGRTDFGVGRARTYRLKEKR